jgi:hypothetical protein
MSALPYQTNVNSSKYYFLLNNASTFTAQTINTSNLNVSGTATVQTLTVPTEATINSISTNSVELDGAYLTTANGTELLLNGVPLATLNNLSSIADWATEPAISTIQSLGANDIGTAAAPFRTGYFSTLVAVNAIFQSTTLTLQETLSSLFVNIVDASTINAQVGNISSVFALQSQISSLVANNIQASNISTNSFIGQTGFFSSLNVTNLNVSTITGDINLIFSTPSFSTLRVQNLFATNADFSSMNTNFANIQTLSSLTANFNTAITRRELVSSIQVLNISSGTSRTTSLTVIGNQQTSGTGFFNNLTCSNTLTVRRVETVSTIRGSRAEFSTLLVRRLEDVDDIQGRLGTFSTLTVSSINLLNPGSNLATSNWSFFPARSLVNMSNFALSNVGTYTGGTINCGEINAGDINGSDVDVEDIDCGDIQADNITVGGIAGLADVEIYGSTALPGDSALYVEGGVEFQGGIIHGFSAGALPVAGINTQRISLTPLGVSVFSPTFISLNSGAVANLAVGGAFSLAVGGVANLAAGTFFEIDSGYMKFINNCPLILSANSGTGAPGGLELNTYTQSNSLQMDGLPFGAQDKYVAQSALQYVSSGSSHQFLETIPLPAIGQWYIKTSYEIKKLTGSGNSTDAYVYMAPSPDPPLSAFNQCIFGAPLYSMPSTQVLTINAPVVISTIAGFTSTIGSTVTENFSTFFSTGQTFSTFTSSFFSTITADGGLNLYFDAIQSQNNFTASLQRASFLASYLGGYIPPA